MSPSDFTESNFRYAPPPDMEASQVSWIAAWRGEAKGGSVDGAPMIVTAWRPTEVELEQLLRGGVIFLTVMGTQLPPHYLSTSFKGASSPS
jgi:hypothetical protein